ncbi:hypothetical protein AgCh_027026 [Apium graveolens]
MAAGQVKCIPAAEDKRYDIVKEICTNCKAPSLDGPGGSTALHAVIKHRKHDIEVVEVLIDVAKHFPASDSDNTDGKGKPVSSFEAFLRRVDEDLDSALHIAIMHGSLGTAELIVKADPSYPGIQNNKGKTPFYIAVERRYADLVKMMCKTCKADQFNLDGPGGSLTAFHAVIKNLKAKNEVRDMILRIIHLYKTAAARLELV